MKPAALFLSALLVAAAAASAQTPNPPPENRGFAQLAPLCLSTKDHKLSKKAQLACEAQAQLSTAVIAAGSGYACPVSMQAKQGSDGGLVKVRHSGPEPETTPPSGPSQHIRLILTHFPKDNRVVSAKVTVSGLSDRSRVAQTGLVTGEAPSDLHRNLDAVFTLENDGTLSAELNLPGFTAVNSVRIQSLTYADGATAPVPDAQACSVIPDYFMRIAGR